MAAFMNSMPATACKTGIIAETDLHPTNANSELEWLREMCASVDGMMLDHVFLVLGALDIYGGQRELGDLVDMISDLRYPLAVIEAMIDYGLIGFVDGYAFDASIPVQRIS